jgi:hypothetical protein
MGAAASFECQRPVDASDIRESGSVDVALAEVVRLRQMLGHLAKDNGFADVDYSGSDLVQGVDENDDFERCVNEIAHIRSCLQLATQNSRRRGRNYTKPVVDEEEDACDSKSDSESDCSDVGVD